MDIHTSSSCKRDYIGVVSQGMEQDGIIYFPLVQIQVPAEKMQRLKNNSTHIASSKKPPLLLSLKEKRSSSSTGWVGWESGCEHF